MVAPVRPGPRIALASLAAPRTERGWGFPASAMMHAAVVTALILLPLTRPAPLPEHRAVPLPPLPTGIRLLADAVGERLRGSPRPATPRPVRRATAPLLPPAIVPEVLPPEPDPIVGAGAAEPCLGCVVGDAGDSDVGATGPGVGEGGPGGGGTEVGTPLRVSSGVDAPAKLVHVDPRYPDLAIRARIQGTVVLECVIDPAGNVAEVEVRSGHALLRAAAVEAVRRWRYSPTRLNGVPVSVILTVTVRFHLQPTTS